MTLTVLTVADNFIDYASTLNLRARVHRNRQKFCDRWNYTCMLIDAASLPTQQFPITWSKLDLAKLAMTTNDFVLVIDADAVIMQNNIDVGIVLKEMVVTGRSLAISSDINNVNSGIFILRRGPWTEAFFNEMRHIRPTLARDTVTIPLKYENRAFFNLTGLWPTDCLGTSRIDTWLAHTITLHIFERGCINRSGVCLIRVHIIQCICGIWLNMMPTTTIYPMPLSCMPRGGI